MTQTTQLFLKIPKKLLFSNELTAEECILYAYLLDKRKLSEHTMLTSPGKFKDQYGIFCNASVEELCVAMKCKKDKIIKMKKKLKDVGLIKERRQLVGSNKIYVSDVDESIEITHNEEIQKYIK